MWVTFCHTSHSHFLSPPVMKFVIWASLPRFVFFFDLFLSQRVFNIGSHVVKNLCTLYPERSSFMRKKSANPNIVIRDAFWNGSDRSSITNKIQNYVSKVQDWTNTGRMFIFGQRFPWKAKGLLSRLSILENCWVLQIISLLLFSLILFSTVHFGRRQSIDLTYSISPSCTRTNRKSKIKLGTTRLLNPSSK